MLSFSAVAAYAADGEVDKPTNVRVPKVIDNPAVKAPDNNSNNGGSGSG
jgi:hypothetical protein